MKIWTYISTLFAGIIAGLVIFLKLDTPETVINENTRIGKMKQRGEGNDANITIDRDAVAEPSRHEVRKAGRLERRRERQEKRQADSP